MRSAALHRHWRHEWLLLIHMRCGAARIVGRAAALRRSSSARTGSRSAAWLGKNLVTTLQPLHVRHMAPQRCTYGEHKRAIQAVGTLAELTPAELPGY